MASTTLWYDDYVNFIVIGVTPPALSPDGKRKFTHDVRFYHWYEPFLFKHYADQLVRCCIPKEEMEAIFYDCHASPYGVHHGGDKTTAKVLQWAFIGPLFSRMHMLLRIDVIGAK